MSILAINIKTRSYRMYIKKIKLETVLSYTAASTARTNPQMEKFVQTPLRISNHPSCRLSVEDYYIFVSWRPESVSLWSVPHTAPKSSIPNNQRQNYNIETMKYHLIEKSWREAYSCVCSRRSMAVGYYERYSKGPNTSRSSNSSILIHFIRLNPTSKIRIHSCMCSQLKSSIQSNPLQNNPAGLGRKNT